MRWREVPASSAARVTLPPLNAMACWVYSRSNLRFASLRATGSGWMLATAGAGASAGASRARSGTMRKRCTALASSRTLPGQLYTAAQLRQSARGRWVSSRQRGRSVLVALAGAIVLSVLVGFVRVRAPHALSDIEARVGAPPASAAVPALPAPSPAAPAEPVVVAPAVITLQPNSVDVAAPAS